MNDISLVRNDDPVTLQNIKQIPGMRGIVTAIYDVPVDKCGVEKELDNLKSDVEQSGLKLSVY